MGETYLHVTSSEVYSKRFSDYLKQFHADDSDDAKKDDKKQRLKNQPTKREVRGKRFNHPRRMSESSLLPPINMKTDVSTPMFSNGVWTFRGSKHADAASQMTGLGIGRVLQPKEQPEVSISPRKDVVKLPKTLGTSLDVSKSPDSVRLSPKVPSDKKSKSDKKVATKHSDNNTPRLVPKVTGDTQRNKVKGHHKNHKYKQLDEPFSIRRKIEQFKRYHEEQYLLKLQKLKQDSEIRIELSKRKPSLEKKTVSPRVKRAEKAPPRIDKEAVTSGDDADSGNESAFNISTIIKSTASRHKSAKTWRTWRDVNDSYAYTDVNKYIEDNELMTPEKSDWIKGWMLEVDREFFQIKNDTDVEEHRSSSSPNRI